MVLVLGSTLIIIFFFLSALHFYWAFGGKWGIDTALPTDENSAKVLRPKTIATVVVGLGLLFFSLFYALKMGGSPINEPAWPLSYIGWIIPSIFLVRVIGDFKYVGLFKKVKTTRFAKADSRYFIPICAFLVLAGYLFQTYS